MVFELFAAATMGSIQFWVNPPSVVYREGVINAWVEERHNGYPSRFYVSSACGTAEMIILTRLNYNGHRWVRDDGLESKDLYQECNLMYAVLRQELCHYED